MWMKNHLKIRVWLIIAVICCPLLMGCADSEDKTEQITQSGQELTGTLGLEPDFSYARIEQIPSIRIDQEGYRTDSRKNVFIVTTRELKKEFEVQTQKEQKTVLTGNLVLLRQDKKTNECLYIGDFSSFAEEGSYRIYQAETGYSYAFVIDDSIYLTIIDQLYQSLIKKTEQKTSQEIYKLSMLMLTEEVYPYVSVQKKNDNLEKQIERLCTYQDEETGAMPLLLEGADQTASLSATAEFAGLMAQYAGQVQQKDAQKAAEYLQRARKAYTYMEQYRDNVSTDSWYYAAAFLYKATGRQKYSYAIREYDLFPVQSRTISECDFTCMADLAYMMTTYKTDFKRCQERMKIYTDRASDISVHTQRENFYVADGTDKLSNQVLMDQIFTLSIVNHVLSGREYAAIQENYIHYLFGVNQMNCNRLLYDYTSDSSMEAIKEHDTELVKLYFILRGLHVK